MREPRGTGDELDLQAIEAHLDRKWPTFSHLVEAYFYARQLLAEIRRMEKAMGKTESDDKCAYCGVSRRDVDSFVESYTRHGFTEEITDRVLAEAAYRQILAGKADPVSKQTLGRRFKGDGTLEQLLGRLAEGGYLPVMADEEATILVSPGMGSIQILNRGKENLFIEVTALRSGSERVREIIDSVCEERRKAREDHRAPLYALVYADRTLDIVPVGRVGVPYIPTNYPVAVEGQFRDVAKQLQADDPHGRLLLLDGPTGVGKTYLIRALMQKCEYAVFAVVMPDALPHLGGPGILPVLMDHVAGSDRKLVLVIEDGDVAVRRRTKSKSTSSIAALLNLSEGLLGSALDLRIVVTTNTEIDEIDPAVSRAGRMMSHMRLRPLGIDDAMRALQAIRPGADKNPDWRDQVCLSDVYAWAFDLGYEVPEFQRAAPLDDENTALRVVRRKGRAKKRARRVARLK